MKKDKEKHPKTLVEIVKLILPNRARPSTVDQRPLVTITVPSTSASEEDIRGRPFSILADQLVEEQQYSSLRNLSSQRSSGSENSLSETEHTSVQQRNTTPKTRSLPDLSDILDNSEEPDQTIVEQQKLPSISSTQLGESDNVNRGEGIEQNAELLEHLTLRGLSETEDTISLFDEFREIAARHQQSTPKSSHQQKRADNNPDFNNFEESSSAEPSERTGNREESEQMANQEQQVMNSQLSQPNPNDGANNIVRNNQITTRMTDDRMRIDPFSGDTNTTVSDS